MAVIFGICGVIVFGLLHQAFRKREKGTPGWALLLAFVVSAIGMPTLAWGIKMDTRWQFTETDKVIQDAWTPETSGKLLAFSFSCDSGASHCGLFLSLPIGCEEVPGKIVAVPIKLGDTDDVAHLQCVGPDGAMQINPRGVVGVHNMGILSDEGEPVRIGVYIWSVTLTKYSGQVVPDMDDEKSITFVLGKAEYQFNLYQSYKAFKKVHKSAAGQK